MSDAVDAPIEAYLRPIARFLNGRDDAVMEVCINGPGAAYVERAGGKGWERVPIPDIRQSWAENLARTIANANGRKFTERMPLLSAQLPGGHRIQVLTGHNVKTGIAISIRVKRRWRPSLKDWGLTEEQIEQLREAVIAGKAVLVVGGTSTGKTAFLNALLAFMPLERRALIIEDVEELEVPVDNRVQVFLSRTEAGTDLTYSDVINSALRFRPDVILCGELSVDNAAAIYRLMDTGHDGLMMTIHAGAPLLALEAWRRNWEMATGGNGSPLIAFLANVVELIVQLKRDRDGRRVMTEMVRARDLEWQSLVRTSY